MPRKHTLNQQSIDLLSQWGADEWLMPSPVDYSRQSKKRNRAIKKIPRQIAEKPYQKPAMQTEITRSEPEITRTERVKIHPAVACTSLQELKKAIENFEGCALKQTAQRTVISDGNPKTPLMIIGEGPGTEEDRQGKPFVGESGQLLDRMLAAIGIKNREAYFITNIIYWRPPGNRTPFPEEIDLCRPFFEKMITLVEPKVLLTLGGSATSALLKKPMGITKMRGQWYVWGEKAIPALASFHPSFLLRRPEAKALAWRDMLTLKKKLKDIRPN